MNALQEIVTVNEPMVTASSIRVPKCSVAEGVTEVCATSRAWNFMGLLFRMWSP